MAQEGWCTDLMSDLHKMGVVRKSENRIERSVRELLKRPTSSVDGIDS